MPICITILTLPNVPKTLSDFGGGGCLMVEMQPKTDAQLLRDYTERGSEGAFAEIVTRYTDLVYSAAMRQTGSPDLARDIGQSVFTDLARKAEQISRTLAENASLAGWLYRGTRFAALTLRRGEQRRQIRERQAMEHIDSTETSPDWRQISPLLDEAMAELDETDREALLLRFFKNEDLRAVGSALGISDDAAQKRVSRAVERLREIFGKRGVAVGAGGLTAAVCANAVQAAPAGLSTVFTTTAIAGAASILATHTTAITMSLINAKTIAAIAAAAIVAGTGTYFVQQREVNRLRNENRNLIAQQDNLARERDKALSAATTSGNEMTQSQKDKDDLLRLRNEVGALRRKTKEMESLRGENKRLEAALSQANQTGKSATDSPEDDPARKMAIAKLNDAKLLVLGMLLHAGDYNGQYPTNLSDLSPYLNSTDQKLSGSNQFELVLHGAQDALTNPSTTIAVRETQASFINGKWVKAYGFADGHSEIKPEPDGGFDAWEAQHIVPPPDQ